MISQPNAIAAASEALMRSAYQLDRIADATFDPVKLGKIAAQRAQLQATAQMVESWLNDGGTFNDALWQPAALCTFVERELAADDCTRAAADATVVPMGTKLVPLWLE